MSVTGTATMRGYVKRSTRPGDAGVTSLAVPVPDAGQVVLRVDGCGICGSDLHALRSDPGYEMMRPPVVLGHELTGTVTATGDGAGPWRPGDRAVAVSIQGCGTCPRCQAGRSQLCADRRILGIHHDGGLAAYVRVAARHLVAVPPEVEPLDAALTEPLSVAVHAVLERTTVRPGARVVVTGPGTIGLLCGQLARASGGDVLVLGAGADAARRLPLARELGLAAADLSRHTPAEAIRARFGGHAPDVWLEAAGAPPAFDAAVAETAPGGHITVIAQYAKRVEMFVPDLLRREITLAFSYAANPAAYTTALTLLAAGTVTARPLITAFPLGRAPEAFTAAAHADIVKAVIVPAPS